MKKNKHNSIFISNKIKKKLNSMAKHETHTSKSNVH